MHTPEIRKALDSLKDPELKEICESLIRKAYAKWAEHRQNGGKL